MTPSSDHWLADITIGPMYMELAGLVCHWATWTNGLAWLSTYYLAKIDIYWQEVIFVRVLRYC